MMFGATFAGASLTAVAFSRRNDWSNMFNTPNECSDINEKYGACLFVDSYHFSFLYNHIFERFSKFLPNVTDRICRDEKPFDPRRMPLSAREDPFHRSRRNRPLNDLDLKIFSGSASKELAEEIADHLGTKISGSETGKFADGETYVRVNETVRGKDCYIIQSTCPPANDNLMELFLMISTLKRASAKSITAVIPYYGYARQDRKTEDRVSIAGADVARLLETMGVDSVISVDLHCWQIEGFFENKTPVINLEAGIIGMEYVLDDFGIENIDDLVVVSPDAGGVGRAKRFQGALLRRGFPGVTLAMIIKQRPKPGVVARMDLIGSVEGKD